MGVGFIINGKGVQEKKGKTLQYDIAKEMLK